MSAFDEDFEPFLSGTNTYADEDRLIVKGQILTRDLIIKFCEEWCEKAPIDRWTAADLRDALKAYFSK